MFFMFTIGSLYVYNRVIVKSYVKLNIVVRNVTFKIIVKNTKFYHDIFPAFSHACFPAYNSKFSVGV